MSRVPTPYWRAEDAREAAEVALIWAMRKITPAGALEGLGVSWLSEREPDWYDVQLAIMSAIRAMRAPWKRKAA
jgi:hypothetical protein